MPDLEELTPDGGSGDEGRGDDGRPAGAAETTNVASPSSSRPSPSSLRMRGLEVTIASERLREINAARGRDRGAMFQDREDQPPTGGTSSHFVMSPAREKNAWLTKRGRRRRSADGGSRQGTPGGNAQWQIPSPSGKQTNANRWGTPVHDSTQVDQTLDQQMDQWLRHTVERMPVKPDHVSGVRGPLMNVAQVDDKTVDVTMTSSFRAHFTQPIATLAAESGVPGVARGNALELPAPGDISQHEIRNTPGRVVEEVHEGAALVVGGGVTPGHDGGRFGIASPDDYVHEYSDRNETPKKLLPLMNVAQVDDKTVDVTMTSSFRAHFTQPIATLAAESGVPGVARGNALELPAPGDISQHEIRNTPGRVVEEVHEGAALVVGGGVTPGHDGGRFGIASPDDYVHEYSDRNETPKKLLLLSDSETALVHATDEWLVEPSDIRLHERVAVGGFAEVFRGTWNGTTVAVKQLLERGPDVVHRLREEVVTLSKLRHPNLLLFMGWCASPPLIATEFMRRGSLHTIFKRNLDNLGAPRTHHCAVCVAKGMQYLHSRNPPILHLDLKSPNILVDDKWRVKIADFGLARVRRNTLVSGKSGFHGTPEWMAPEMLRAEDYDEKADVYSFGVVLWELLTAKTPWNELHPMQVVAVVGYSDRRLVLPSEAEAFVSENLVTRTMGELFWECAEKSASKRPDFDLILQRLERAPSMLLPGPDGNSEGKRNSEISPGDAVDVPAGAQSEHSSKTAPKTTALEIEEIEETADDGIEAASAAADSAQHSAKQFAGEYLVHEEV